MKPLLSNIEIAIYALYLLDGISSRVHTEDVALKCFELAPDSFSWTKYPKYPDKEVVRFALEDAGKKRGGMLVQGRSKTRVVAEEMRQVTDPAGWMLTSAGASWIAINAARIEAHLKIRKPNDHRQEVHKKLGRLRGHALFQSYLRKPADFRPSLGEIAEYFRCRMDADQVVWQKRFESVRNLAQTLNDLELAAFIDRCKSIVESPMAS